MYASPFHHAHEVLEPVIDITRKQYNYREEYNNTEPDPQHIPQNKRKTQAVVTVVRVPPTAFIPKKATIKEIGRNVKARGIRVMVVGSWFRNRMSAEVWPWLPTRTSAEEEATREEHRLPIAKRTN